MKALLIWLGASICAAALPAPALAQDTRPLTIVVPAPPGGANDALARLLGIKLQEATGQPVVVLNKPGGNLVVGTQFVIASPPDGRTLLLVGNSAVTVNPVLNPNLPYDAQKDLVPVSRLAVLEMLMVAHPSLPANSVEELVAYAKANPNAINYGAGTPIYQVAMETFKHLTGAPITHIPYTGTAKAIGALLAGEVQVAISESTSSAPHVKAGKLKALAAMPRVAALPELGSMAKSVPGFDVTVWLGLFAPKGTPAAVVAKLHADVERVVALPDTRQKMSDMGMLPVGGTPDELARTILQDTQNVRALAKSANIQPS